MADSIEDRTVKPKQSDLVEEEGFLSKSALNVSERDNAEPIEDVSTNVVREAIPRASTGAGLDGEDGVVLVESAITGNSVADLPSELLYTSSVTNDSAGTNMQKEVQFMSARIHYVKSLAKYSTPLPKRQKELGKGRYPTKLTSESYMRCLSSWCQVDVVTEWDNNNNTEVLKPCEVDKALQEDAVGNSDNTVLRQLLRGPRYFDPLVSSWGTCYKCGEDHSAAKCKPANRKKPCFVCGSLIHGGRQCQKSRGCFICKQGGHVAKACPRKFKDLFQGCLKCGSHGHDMFSCTDDYSLDDLKDIKCYICKEVGHLCCANYFWSVSTVVSCYKCGQLGHTGLECSGSDGEKAADRTPISCFKCGEDGHFSRSCKSTAKAKKRKRKWTSPKKKGSKEGKAYKGYKSTPHDASDAQRSGNLELDGVKASSRKRKVRGGWIMDDPGDISAGESSQYRGWKSPRKSSAKKKRTANWSTKRRDERSNTHYGDNGRAYGGSPSSVASRNFFEHGYTASRFGNPSAGGLSKENQWW